MKEYSILRDGGTEMGTITEAEAKAILDSAETRQSSLSEYEKREIEASLLESDSDAEDYSNSECLAVRLSGAWYYLPKAYR